MILRVEFFGLSDTAGQQVVKRGKVINLDAGALPDESLFFIGEVVVEFGRFEAGEAGEAADEVHGGEAGATAFDEDAVFELEADGED